MQLAKSNTTKPSESFRQYDKNKKGQTAVEFILMIAVVAGIMTLVGPILDERISNIVGEIVGGVNTVGWTGGYQPSSPEQPLNAHYMGGEAQMSRH